MQLTGTNRPRTYHKTHPLCSSRSTGTHPHNSTQVTAAIAEGKRPDPSRTRKLSPPAPMVLHPPGCGRVGHRRTQPHTKGPQPRGPFFLCHRYAVIDVRQGGRSHCCGCGSASEFVRAAGRPGSAANVMALLVVRVGVRAAQSVGRRRPRWPAQARRPAPFTEDPSSVRGGPGSAGALGH